MKPIYIFDLDGTLAMLAYLVSKWQMAISNGYFKKAIMNTEIKAKAKYGCI